MTGVMQISPKQVRDPLHTELGMPSSEHSPALRQAAAAQQSDLVNPGFASQGFASQSSLAALLGEAANGLPRSWELVTVLGQRQQGVAQAPRSAAGLLCLLEGARELGNIHCAACQGFGHTAKKCPTKGRLQVIARGTHDATKLLRGALDAVAAKRNPVGGRPNAPCQIPYGVGTKRRRMANGGTLIVSGH
jgi:hypothetical protein